MTTHFIPLGAPRLGDKLLALCDEWVDADTLRADPGCPKCQRKLNEDETQIEALRLMNEDPRR